MQISTQCGNVFCCKQTFQNFFPPERFRHKWQCKTDFLHFNFGHHKFRHIEIRALQNSSVTFTLSTEMGITRGNCAVIHVSCKNYGSRTLTWIDHSFMPHRNHWFPFLKSFCRVPYTVHKHASYSFIPKNSSLVTIAIQNFFRWNSLPIHT